jgi:hypothetical protein
MKLFLTGKSLRKERAGVREPWPPPSYELFRPYHTNLTSKIGFRIIPLTPTLSPIGGEGVKVTAVDSLSLEGEG